MSGQWERIAGLATVDMDAVPSLYLITEFIVPAEMLVGFIVTSQFWAEPLSAIRSRSSVSQIVRMLF